MVENGTVQGNYTVFGFSRYPEKMKQRLRERLGIQAKTINIGEQGEFFYYTTNAEVAETAEVVVLKLGFARSNTKNPLRAASLLAQQIVAAHHIQTEALSGNCLVVGISKKEPVFTVFQTLMAVPQLYYAESREGIVCSDVLQSLLQIIPNREVDESILPQHFLFRSIYGAQTYFKGVKRLLTGHSLRWMNGECHLQLVRSLDQVRDEADYIRDERLALSMLNDVLDYVVGDYVRQIEEKDAGYANLLSGGVDSTLVQSYLNLISPQQTQKSISYAVHVPSFQFEINYARDASQALNTEHTFVDLTAQDFLHLLTRTIDRLGQPPNLEIEPSLLAVAEYIQSKQWPETFFFSANAADAIFGNPDTLKLKGLHYLQSIPGAANMLKGIGKTFAPLNARFHTLEKGAEMIANQHNPDAYCSPANMLGVAVFGDVWNMLRRSFGDERIREVFASRRALAKLYSAGSHYLDQVHFIDQLTFTYEVAVQEQQLFLAQGLEMAHPFNDEDVLKTAFLIHPDLRYIKRFTPKHLLKQLLEQKSLAKMARRRKGGSAVNEDLIEWMKTGALRPLVEDIDRPGFISKPDFDHLIQQPNYFLWSLLTYDLFVKRI